MSKKIIHLCASYAPHLGGVETHVRQSCNELHKLGYTNTVITVQSDPKDPLKEIIDEVLVLRIPREVADSKLGVWKWIVSQRKLFSQSYKIHAHDVGWWLLPLLLFSTPIRQKFFITFHGWEGYPVRWQAKLHRFLLAQLSRGSIHIGSWIQNWYWDKPDAVSYGAPTLKKTKIESLLRNNHLTKIVFVGRLEPENAIAEYCQVFEQLKKSNVKIKVIWVGDGSLRSRCEKIGSITGMVKNPWDLVSQADLVCANSYLAIWDTLTLGKKVVAFAQHELKYEYLKSFPIKNSLIIGTDVHETVTEIKKWLQLSGKQQVAELRVIQKEANETSWKNVATMYTQLWEREL